MNLLEAQDHGADRDEILNKWKDKPAEDVLKAKVESDLHIKTLEREKQELRQMYLEQREELQTKAKFEEYLDRMKDASKPNLQVAYTPAKEVESPRYDPKEVEALVRNTIRETESTRSDAENYRKVEAKLKERFGDNFASVLKEQQTTLGLSTEDVNTIAKKSPEAFFRIMELNTPSKDLFQAPPPTRQRNDSFAPRGEPRRDWNYYQELKKTNPMMYLDPKISVQMEKDAQALGDAFGLPSD